MLHFISTDTWHVGIEKKATSYGTSISGQSYQPSPKALPSTARKPVIKRSNSTPASNKPTTGVSRSVGATPLGANKYPGANQVNGAKKAVTAGTGTARSTVGSATGGATKVLGGATKPLGAVGQKALPKAYPGARSNSLPKPYNSTTPFSSSEKKSAVKPGQPKPFAPPVAQKKPDVGKKAYPGTNSIPGQGSKVPVQNQKQRLKPLPRMGAQVGEGQKMVHLAV
jgi:hypothetical protein